jgi:hypothetical protein
MLKKYILLLTLLMLPWAMGLAQSSNDSLLLLSKQLHERYFIEKQQALIQAANTGLDVRIVFSDSTVAELQRFDNGFPVYYITQNLGGAKAIKTNDVWPGGIKGLHLSGQDQVLAIWDAGALRTTHQELLNKIIPGDDASEINFHATHVATTMVGYGVKPEAKGMAFNAKLQSFDWNNDASEMADAAAKGLMVSQHSYGQITGWHYNTDKWQWWGDTTVSSTEDYIFGFYTKEASSWDQIANLAPYYTIVKSAGNDRGEGPEAGEGHYVWGGKDWVWSTTPRPKDGGVSGYDCISGAANAKNIITVGAVTETGLMTSFSAWGPTDDGRIKPDIVAKGFRVYSANSNADNNYSLLSGTSMAGPMVSGSIGLLLEHQANLMGMQTPLWSSTIKALILHTAQKPDNNPGPDYRRGWGMMNTARAVEVMSHNALQGGKFLIREYNLKEKGKVEFSVKATGNEPLIATVVWNDPAAAALRPALDPVKAMLINDLDIRISNSTTTFMPWILDPENPANPPSTGDNFRDNVEQVYIASPSPGETYTITVNHKKLLKNKAQDFSIVISGISTEKVFNPNSFVIKDVQSDLITLGWEKNFNQEEVILVWSTNESIGTPQQKVQYKTGETLPGGGMVIYTGSNIEFTHYNLEEGTSVFYKLFSVNQAFEYSSGLHQDATTPFADITGPESDMAALPFDFNRKYSLSQSLYYKNEIMPEAGSIKGLQLFYHFDQDKTAENIKIWIGETAVNSLENEWISSSQLQLVYQGDLSFRKGQAMLEVPFSTNYLYKGNNLIFQFYQADTGNSPNNWFYVSTQDQPHRTRYVITDHSFDLINPPPGVSSPLYPNLNILISEENTDLVSGLKDTDVWNKPMEISPNPAKDLIKVTCRKPIRELRIYSSAGEMKYKYIVTYDYYTVNVSSLAPGIYIIQAITDEGIFSEKLYIAR